MACPQRTSSDLVDPARDVNVRVAGIRLVSVRSKGEPLAVRRKHRGAVEPFRERNLFQIGPVDIDDKDVELPAPRIVVTGPAVRRDAEFAEARMVRNCTETGITRIFLPSDLQLDSWC